MTDRFFADAEIVRQIYDGILQHDHWPRLLGRLTREFHSTYSVFMRQDRLTGSAHVTATDVVPPDRLHAYETYYAQRTPTLHHWDTLCAGTVLTDEHYDAHDDYLRSEIYNDFLRPLDADHMMCLQLWHETREDKCVVVRRSRRAGPFSKREAARLHHLGEHLRNAERLWNRLCATETLSTNLGVLLDRLGVAAFVTDRFGLIRYMTPSAEQLLRKGRVFRGSGGRLHVTDAGLDNRLQKAIPECVASLDNPRKSSRCALRGNAARDAPLTILISALAWTDAARMSQTAALVVVVEPGEPYEHQETSMTLLAELFDLTPAQSRVAAALCDGQSLADHAVSENISILTARTLLKRAQEKTETHSQAELVSLLLRNTRAPLGSR